MKWINYTLKTVMITFLVMCAWLLYTPGIAVSAEQSEVKNLSSIESINVTGDGATADLVIKLTAPATYTSYKTTSPLRLVIDLSQVAQGNISTPIVINKGNFKSVTANRFDTDAGVLTRVEIELLNDGEALIVASPDKPEELRISYPTSATTATAVVSDIKDSAINNTAVVETPAKIEAEATFRSLTAISAANNTITLAIDGMVGDFKTFRLNKPERFVIDLMNVKSVMAAKLIPLNAAGIASARIGLYPDKVRIVLDAVNGSFPETNVLKTETGIMITVDAKPAVDGKASIKPSETKDLEPATAVTAKVEKEVAKPLVVEVKAEAVKPAIVEKAPVKSIKKGSSVALVEAIDFQVIDGISRVAVKVNGDVSVEPPVKSPGFVTLTIKNSTLSKSQQRSFDARAFVSPVLRITPLLVKTKKGTETKIRIATRFATPFEFRQEADMLFVDFKNPEGATGDKLIIEATNQTNRVAQQKPVKTQEEEINSDFSTVAEPVVKSTAAVKGYRGRKVTLEFADAEVRKIFQLLSEVSNKNFVLGDEVAGAISLKLVNVPWDQALDIILDTKGLDKREDGNIILIKGKGKFKSQADEELEIKKTLAKGIELKTEVFNVNYSDVTGISAQFNSIKSDRGVITIDTRTGTVIVKDIPQALDDMRKLLALLDKPEKQVMIEARIIVATSEFTKDFGIQWGAHYKDGSSSFMGINSLDTGFGGVASSPPQSGQFSVAPGVATGISFGKLASNIQLDMRLSAATAASMIKVVASPKVVTLNHESAKIEQGQTTYVQTTDSTGKTNATPVKATLKLDVTPSINSNNTLTLKIDASDDSFGTPPAGATSVAINNRTATSKILLKNGETAVIGGIFREQNSDGNSGVPYLKDIPLIGYLFKSSSTVNKREELLIFITPRVIEGI